MNGNTVTLHSPEQIISSLENHPIATLGVSPEVHSQTTQIIKRMGQLVSSEKVIGAQLLGSRANGTAVLESDVDCAFLAFDDEYPDVYEISGTILRERGVSCDPTCALTCLGITAAIPSDLASFEYWAESTRPFSLFNRGISIGEGETDGTLPLLQLTAIELQMQYDRGTRNDLWRGMREEYELAYLGDPRRIRSKLKERVGSYAAMMVTDDVMQRRYSRFGMPPHIEIARERLIRDCQPTISAKTSHPKALELYHETIKQIAA